MKKVVLFAATLIASMQVNAQQPDAKTTTEQFGDWQLICSERGEEKSCRGSQTLANEQGRVVGLMNLIKDSEGKPTVELGLPLLVDLVHGTSIKIDDKKAVKYPYNLCNNQACFVLNGDTALLQQLNAGTTAAVTFKSTVAADELTLNFSLKGFSAVNKALVSR
jgi:invasion protein IalB